MRETAGLAVCVVLTVLATACTRRVAHHASTAVTTTTANRSSNDRLAALGVLRRADLPPVWVDAGKPPSWPRGDRTGSGSPDCRGDDNAVESAVVKSSSEFVPFDDQNGGVRTSNVVFVYPSDAGAKAAMSVWAASSYGRCWHLRSYHLMQRHQNPERNTFTVTRRAPTDTLGPGEVVWLGAVRRADGSGSDEEQSEFVRIGRAVENFVVDDDPSGTRERGAFRSAISRLQHAQS